MLNFAQFPILYSRNADVEKLKEYWVDFWFKPRKRFPPIHVVSTTFYLFIFCLRVSPATYCILASSLISCRRTNGRTALDGTIVKNQFTSNLHIFGISENAKNNICLVARVFTENRIASWCQVREKREMSNASNIAKNPLR